VDLLEIVKKALRVTHNALDDAEIIPLIDAAKKELTIAGVAYINDADPLIVRYVAAYCKAHFGYDNPEAERFERIANSLKHSLTLITEYNTAKPTPEGGGGAVG